MARVTADGVKSIMPECTLDNSIIDAFIIGANLVVDKVYADDTTVGSALLIEIERWYAAHMVASTSWRLHQKEKVGEAEVQYIGEYGEGLSSTPYGQQVELLDPTGKMANLGKKEASMYAVKSFEE